MRWLNRLLALAAMILLQGRVVAGPPAAKLQLQPPRDVEFKAAVDGSLQRYVEMLPPGYDPGKTYDLLIALHGATVDRWAYVLGQGQHEGVRDVAANRGLILVCPDYRAKNSWLGPKAEADLLQIIAKLKTERKIGRLFLVGASMGGTSVLIFTALHPDLVAGVSSQNPTANLLEYGNYQVDIAASYGGSKAEQPAEYRKRSPELFPEKFLGIPVAITTGGRDTIVPPDSARRLANKLEQQNARNVLLIDRAETGHNTSYGDAVKALEFVLDRASPPARH